MTVCIIGMGYIGLPLGAVLAGRGVRVYGVDVRETVVETLNRGSIHIHECGLAEVVDCVVQKGLLSASTTPCEADIFVIAVPTPFKDSHIPDVSYIEQAVAAIAPRLRAGNTVILESTSPVGTAERVSTWIQALRPDLYCPVRGAEPTGDQIDRRIYVAYCPERVLPGQILRELVENDRLVGGVDSASAPKGSLLYEQFVKGRIHLTDSRTAEMCKLTENAYRDVNIAFANEISMICDQIDIDPYAVIEMANHHPRVNILQPGPGVGGHCIAVDPWFIVDSAPTLARLIRTSREVNDSKPEFVINKIESLAENLVSPTIVCLGLAFKPGVDDLRESPAVEITRALAEKQIGRIIAVEPHIKLLPPDLQGMGITLLSLEAALDLADIVVLLVNHEQFLTIDRACLASKRLLDTRGVWR